MDPAKIRALLGAVQSGSTSVEDAFGALKDLPYADLGYAMVDHHRALRQGVPEVIFGAGKTVAQIVGIATELGKNGQNVLITRIEESSAREVMKQLPKLAYFAAARVATLEQA